MSIRQAVLGIVLGMGLLGCQAGPPAGPAAAPAAGAAPSGAGAPSAQAPRAAAPLQKLTIAVVSPNELMAVPWVAQDSGILAKYGFDAQVLIVPGSPRVTQSLIAGDFDYAIAGSSSFIRARLQGADVQILATSVNTAGNFSLLVLPESGIRTVADLRGKTVGVTQYGSDADVFLRLALNRAGLSANDVTIIQHGGSPQGAAALLTGQLPAAVVGGSAVLTATSAGAVAIATGKELRIPGLTGTIATTRRRIERAPDEVLRFMYAYVEAIHFLKTRREETIAILHNNWANMPTEEIAYLYDEVADDYLALPIPSDEAVMAIVEREADPATLAQVKPTDFYDASFLRQIEQSGFLRELYR